MKLSYEIKNDELVIWNEQETIIFPLKKQLKYKIKCYDTSWLEKGDIKFPIFIILMIFFSTPYTYFFGTYMPAHTFAFFLYVSICIGEGLGEFLKQRILHVSNDVQTVDYDGKDYLKLKEDLDNYFLE